MSPDAVVFVGGLLACAAGMGFIGGLAVSADFWAHRTKCREMDHKERMAALQHRAKLLELKE